jgi:spore photoproduct lyase
VRLAFDPILLFNGWRTAYDELIATTFRSIPAALIEAATYGVFRMSWDYLDRIRRERVDSPVLFHPFSRNTAVATYTADEIAAIESFVGERLRRHMPGDAVSFVHG